MQAASWLGNGGLGLGFTVYGAEKVISSSSTDLEAFFRPESPADPAEQGWGRIPGNVRSNERVGSNPICGAQLPFTALARASKPF